MSRTLERRAYLDDREVAALLRVARERRSKNARRDHLLLALLLNTGVRPGEALALCWSDVTLSDRSPQIRVRRLKKRRDRGVIDDMPISRALGRAIRFYQRQLETAPEDTERIFPMTVRNAQLLFKRYARLAGIDSQVHLYALRHTAGTRAWRSSRDLLLVQQQLGHASPITTQIYTHVDPERRRENAERSGSEL